MGIFAHTQNCQLNIFFSQYLVDFKGHISKEGSKHFSGESEQEYNRKSEKRER